MQEQCGYRLIGLSPPPDAISTTVHCYWVSHDIGGSCSLTRDSYGFHEFLPNALLPVSGTVPAPRLTRPYRPNRRARDWKSRRARKKSTFLSRAQFTSRKKSSE